MEHIQPKDLVPELRTSWGNFLLGCVNCNSSKGDQPVHPPLFLWPDLDNTLRAFDYTRGGVVQASANLPPALAAKAVATLLLLGLDKVPGQPGREPTSADLRWKRRQEAWAMAVHYRNELASQDTALARKLLVEVATARGEFSIWWTVFAHDSDMRRRFREAFAGTHAGSFDANEGLTPRAGGQL